VKLLLFRRKKTLKPRLNFFILTGLLNLACKNSKKYMVRFSFLFSALILIWGCKSTQPTTGGKTADSKTVVDAGPAILSFSKENVTQGEFERVYAKNNGGREEAGKHDPEQMREYLDLYIKFKRKVFEAEAMGLDTTPAFKQEFSSYRKQLAQPYLSAKEVEDELIKEAYERSGYLVNASHLLVNVKEGSSPEDTLKAYQTIMGYRDSIMKDNKDFAYMAEKYSDDPSAKQNKGDLGYFSAFDMVYPFENAAFNTPVGEVSMPVKTRFGYHLVYVADRMKSAGKKRVAHIIVRVGDRYSAKTDEQAEAKIKEIYQKLTEGADFAELAGQYSDDPSSASKGGDLGMNRLLPEMENLKLKLNEGEFSDPFTTRFGWHILKVTEVEKLASFEESKPMLKQRISRDSRSQISRKALINKIKKENQFELNQKNFDVFVSLLNENFPRGTWKPAPENEDTLQLELFTLNQSYSKKLKDFTDYYQRTRSRRTGKTPAQAANEILDAYLEQELLKYEEEQLPKKNPEFRYLLKEYRDGILLFTLMEQKVWKKAVEDTTGLKEYYENHKEDFRAGETIDVIEYRSSDLGAMNRVDFLLGEGKNESEIEAEINENSALKLSITRQTYEKDEDDIPVALFDKPVGAKSDILKQNTYHRILVIENKFPAGIQPFDKVKSQAITKYQDYLEQEWLDELANKYPVEIDEAVFSDLFK
jgi:peptidyl-prolyl cis-trans isomerase SurA